MIGVFGGTFDPVHFGHLRTALELHHDLGLEEVRLIPCRLPPHRPPPAAEASQRLAMLKSAVQGQSGLRVDERELNRDGPSYTVLTLRSLKQELPDRTLCTIVGRDAFAELDKWWRWRELLELSHIVVVDRPPGVAQITGEPARLLAERRVASPEQLNREDAGRILTRRVTSLDISATHIRAMIAAGMSPRYLVPDSVMDIMRVQGIYMISN